MRNLFANRYKIVYTAHPQKDMWLKLPFEITYESLPGNNARISWDFESPGDGSVFYFAFAYPYTLEKLERTLTDIQRLLPDTVYFHRETLIYSNENRPIELITITEKGNLCDEEEDRLPHLFPDGERARR